MSLPRGFWVLFHGFKARHCHKVTFSLFIGHYLRKWRRTWAQNCRSPNDCSQLLHPGRLERLTLSFYLTFNTFPTISLSIFVLILSIFSSSFLFFLLILLIYLGFYNLLVLTLFILPTYSVFLFFLSSLSFFYFSIFPPYLFGIFNIGINHIPYSPFVLSFSFLF